MGSGIRHFMWGYITQLPAASRLDSSALTHLLHAAVETGSARYVDSMCALLAAAGTSSLALMQLLLHSMPSTAPVHHPLLKLVMRHPAAEQLSSSELAQLMRDAVQRGASAAVAGLCRKQAAGQLSSGDLLQLLTLAVQRSSSGCVRQLCG